MIPKQNTWLSQHSLVDIGILIYEPFWGLVSFRKYRSHKILFDEYTRMSSCYGSLAIIIIIIVFYDLVFKATMFHKKLMSYSYELLVIIDCWNVK